MKFGFDIDGTISALPDQLLQQVKEYVAAHHDVAGTEPGEVIAWVLECFIVREEWQSLAFDENGSTYADEHSKIYESSEDMLSALGTLPMSPNRALMHRFVLSTEQQVRADLEWKPA